MISYKILLIIGLIHWLADFALQTHWQASNKWNNITALIRHTGTYSLVWLFAGFLMFTEVDKVLVFTIVTFIAHTCTDAVTSRLVHYSFEEQDFHNGFVIVGFDQILHYTQLLVTYALLT